MAIYQKAKCSNNYCNRDAEVERSEKRKKGKIVMVPYCHKHDPLDDDDDFTPGGSPIFWN